MNATRRCKVCHEVLDIEQFTGARRTCESCYDAAAMARPWSTRDYERLRQAATAVARAWPANASFLDDETRITLRELINSLDRRSERAA